MNTIDTQVSHEIPAIYEECHKRFGVNWSKGVIIAYDGKIHCKFDLPPDKIVHEKTHLAQQKKAGLKEWWDRYLNDDKFRLDQEVEAYRSEYQYVRSNVKDRNRRFNFLHLICVDLSSAMYGNLVDYNEAMRLIMK